MWELLYRGGRWVKEERPFLHVPRGHIAVKVKAFLLDDYSVWAASRRLEKIARWAFGNVVGGSGAETGQYVVALAENAAAEYVASRTYFPAPRDPVEALARIHAALALEALDLLPRYRPIFISGDDPRREYIARLARIGESRHGIILQGGAISGGARAVALTRMIEIEGPGSVKFLDIPKKRYYELATGGPRLPVRRAGDETPCFWCVVEI
ncbi:MAG: hypothetical protein ACP5MH_03010 [Thermoproteus sp.]